MMTLDQVREVLEHVEDETNGQFKLYLAGGYLRDVLNGVTPKDIDVMVVPVEDSDAYDFEWCLTDTEFHTEKQLLEECQYMSDMSSRGVSALFMGSYNGDDLQFIVYDKIMTQEQVTLDMDINLCQITMDSSGFIHESDNFIEGFAENKITLHHEYSEKRAQQRVERMLSKYPHFYVD